MPNKLKYAIVNTYCKYIDKGHDKLSKFKREFVVGENEWTFNLLLPLE